MSDHEQLGPGEAVACVTEVALSPYPIWLMGYHTERIGTASDLCLPGGMMMISAAYVERTVQQRTAVVHGLLLLDDRRVRSFAEAMIERLMMKGCELLVCLNAPSKSWVRAAGEAGLSVSADGMDVICHGRCEQLRDFHWLDVSPASDLFVLAWAGSEPELARVLRSTHKDAGKLDSALREFWDCTEGEPRRAEAALEGFEVLVTLGGGDFADVGVHGNPQVLEQIEEAIQEAGAFAAVPVYSIGHPCEEQVIDLLRPSYTRVLFPGRWLKMTK